VVAQVLAKEDTLLVTIRPVDFKNFLTVLPELKKEVSRVRRWRGRQSLFRLGSTVGFRASA
jgi:hypothetical protein